MQFNGDKQYNDFSSFIKSRFSERVQKVSINIGFTCPNRDGTKGLGGCTYCNNNTFSPHYCKPEKNVTQQLNEGISGFSKKYKTQKYLAYFQSYTNTYADIELLKELYLEAIQHSKVVGLVVGTRPDCISTDLVDFLSDLAKNYFVSLELGIESTLDKTLEAVNRCHTYEETRQAYNLVKDRGIHLGGHMIIGLPGETKADILNHARELSKLPLNSLKLHQLQIVKHTMMAVQLKSHPEQFKLLAFDEYVDLITEFIARLRPDIILERFVSESPDHLLIAPKWRMKNFQVTEKVNQRLIEKELWQGKYSDIQLN